MRVCSLKLLVLVGAGVLAAGTMGLAGTALADVHCHAAGSTQVLSDPEGNVCNATADPTSTAEAEATGGSVALANAINGGQATALAGGGSVALADSDQGSATARAAGGAVALAVSTGSGSAASAGATNGSVAIADGQAGGTARACATKGSVAVATGTNPGTQATAEAGAGTVSINTSTSGTASSNVKGGGCEDPAAGPPEAARAAYCVNGSFKNLLLDQPATDPAYKGAVAAFWVNGMGLTCDMPAGVHRLKDGAGNPAFYVGPEEQPGFYPLYGTG
jgi:hypothetical protein